MTRFTRVKFSHELYVNELYFFEEVGKEAEISILNIFAN